MTEQRHPPIKVFTTSSITTTELGYLDNINYNIKNAIDGKISSLDNQRTLNTNRSGGETRILANTLSDSDNGGIEGGPRSQFTVNMRTKRGGTS